MILPGDDAPQPGIANGAPVVFRLYIAGRAPHSLQAIHNLRRICRTYLPERHQIELVDVLEEPLRALADGVLATPALVKVAPPPRWQVIGELSQPSEILLALGLQEGPS